MIKPLFVRRGLLLFLMTILYRYLLNGTVGSVTTVPEEQLIRHLAEQGKACSVGVPLQVPNSFPHVVPGAVVTRSREETIYSYLYLGLGSLLRVYLTKQSPPPLSIPDLPAVLELPQVDEIQVSVTPFLVRKNPMKSYNFPEGQTFYKFYHTKWTSINQHQKPTTIHETVFSTFPCFFLLGLSSSFQLSLS
jgi:hypothetical protein